nr:hypothetical protein MFLOJ_52520 [Mycobacterium florentinum]
MYRNYRHPPRRGLSALPQQDNLLPLLKRQPTHRLKWHRRLSPPPERQTAAGLPGSLFGGLPPNSPATGPHPIHIPHTKDHRFPLLGEIPEEFLGPEE